LESRGQSGLIVQPASDYLGADGLRLLGTSQQIELCGGSRGLRDSAGLESAFATPQATFGGEFLHSTIPAMASAYLFHLCQNHPFIDGNKRVGANAAVTFLRMNNWEPTLDNEEFVDFVLAVASGEPRKPALIEIFEARCKPPIWTRSQSSPDTIGSYVP
jgi:death-on-curing protein